MSAPSVHEAHFPWLTGWNVDDRSPVLGFSHLPAGEWPLAGGIRAHLEFRDSGLAAATDGRIGGQYVRYVGDGSDAGEDHGWHVHDLDWQFSILLAGSMKRATDAFGVLSVAAGDATSYPGLCWHREWDFSHDWEMIAMRIPAKTTTIAGRHSPLPERAASIDPDRVPTVSLDRPDAYRSDPDGRSQFAIRDLGAACLTQGRIGLRILRAAAPGATTCPGRTEASLWCVVLGGTGTLEVEGRPAIPLERLDAVTLPPGSTRNLSAGADGLEVLELRLPGNDGVPTGNA